MLDALIQEASTEVAGEHQREKVFEREHKGPPWTPTRGRRQLFSMLPTVSAKVVVFLLAATAGGLSTAAEPTYIVALGASGIHGKGVSLSEAFPAQLESMLRADGFNVQVINAGVDGDTTTRMLLRMESVIPQATRVTILQPGTNDFKSRKHGLSVEQHLANVEAIVI